MSSVVHARIGAPSVSHGRFSLDLIKTHCCLNSRDSMYSLSSSGRAYRSRARTTRRGWSRVTRAAIVLQNVRGVDLEARMANRRVRKRKYKVHAAQARSSARTRKLGDLERTSAATMQQFYACYRTIESNFLS